MTVVVPNQSINIEERLSDSAQVKSAEAKKSKESLPTYFI